MIVQMIHGYGKTGDSETQMTEIWDTLEKKKIRLNTRDRQEGYCNSRGREILNSLRSESLIFILFCTQESALRAARMTVQLVPLSAMQNTVTDVELDLDVNSFFQTLVLKTSNILPQMQFWKVGSINELHF